MPISVKACWPATIGIASAFGSDAPDAAARAATSLNMAAEDLRTWPRQPNAWARDISELMVMQPGDGSAANDSDDRRIGIAFMYLPTHVRSTLGRRASILVRGEDKFGYWDDDPVPRFDLDPVAMAAMKRAQDAYRDTTVRSEAERAGEAE